MKGIVDIERAALALPTADRVLLAESLLGSLPPLPREWTEAEELEEIAKRDRQVESGEVEPLTEKQFWSHVNSNRKRGG